MSAITHLDRVGFPALLDKLRIAFPTPIAIDYLEFCGISADKLFGVDQISSVTRLGVALGTLIDLKLARGHFYESRDARYYWDYSLTPAGYRVLSMPAFAADTALPGLLAALSEAVPQHA